MLKGSLVAIATPMQPGGELDLSCLRRLIDFHIANGTAGIVIVGTTGESPTVDFDEHCLLIKTAVEHTARRLPVIMYNVPGRTIADLANDTAVRLAGVPRIVGLKDATRDIGRFSELRKALLAAGHDEFGLYNG